MLHIRQTQLGEIILNHVTSGSMISCEGNIVCQRHDRRKRGGGERGKGEGVGIEGGREAGREGGERERENGERERRNGY